MKKKLFVARYYILIFFMSLLTACSVGDSVRVVQMPKTASKSLLPASDSLPGIAVNPADIMVLDSLLLVRDGEQLVICNTDSGVSRTLFGRGRGPGEMLGFYDFSYDAVSREFAMLDASSQSILSTCIDSLLSDDYLPSSVRRSQLLDVPMLFGICFADGSLLGVGMFQDCRVASLAGDAGLGYEPYSSYAPNAGDKESYQDNILNQAYQARMDYEASQRTLVLACRYADQLEFIRDGEVTLVRGPEGVLPMFSVEDAGGFEVLAHDRNERKGFIDLCACRDGVYVLFSGRTVTDENSSFGNEVWLVSWDAALESVYRLDRDVIAIDVASDGKLYAVAADAGIYVYQLPGA